MSTARYKDFVRLPVGIRHTPEIEQLFDERFGTETDLDLYKKLSMDKTICISPIYTSPPLEVFPLWPDPDRFVFDAMTEAVERASK